MALMKLTDLYLAQLERETPGTRKALERVPEGQNDWKPHPKSMPFGYLAALVAQMPAWIEMMIDRDELDLASGQGAQPALATHRELLEVHEQALAKARKALTSTTDEHLMTHWRLLVSGKVVDEKPRYMMITDTFSHLAHHRGQLTVYLRLLGAAVPSIYGPSADEPGF
jgi:uncharacterized damage-inducible protein DinB